jgi:hypothetical protein
MIRSEKMRGLKQRGAAKMHAVLGWARGIPQQIA